MPDVRPTRHFIQLGGRLVHYLRAGNGPPVVLIHSSPANAWLLLDIIVLLAGKYTVFAPDTPGFGLSEPLPLARMSVADLADALADTLAAMAMPPCPMFGTHTGAAIALEFAYRHPHRLTGVVLDGVPVFTEAEYTALLTDYFRPIDITDLGGQYAMAWTRMRDQSIWFPWFSRHPESLNDYDLGLPENTHRWVSMYFDAASHYAPAYRAALGYGAHASTAAAALQVPAIFSAAATDMLYPHLERMRPIRADQEIRRPGQSTDANHAVIVEGFARFGSPSGPPAEQGGIGSSDRTLRQFVDGRDGRQLHLFHAGNRHAPAVLLLHDAPGSAARLLADVGSLAQDHFVIAPDLPGCGESAAFTTQPAIADYTDEIVALLDQLDLSRIDVLGIGFGAAVAIDLAHRHAARIGRCAIRNALLREPAERAALAACYAPPIAIERDGSHWYRTWLMLRDQLVWWPWYDRKAANLRHLEADFSARTLHDWTVDVMRCHASYGQLILAALAYDAIGPLAALATPPLADLFTA